MEVAAVAGGGGEGGERMKGRDSKIIKSATISSPLSLREKKEALMKY